jgi:hypothetical protein
MFDILVKMVRFEAGDAACGLARIPAIHRVNESKDGFRKVLF